MARKFDVFWRRKRWRCGLERLL